MRKIVSGILGIALVVTVISSSAYALFSSSVTVTGISVAAGNAQLQVEGQTGTFNTGLSINDIYPGFEDSTTVSFKNNSSSNIGLNLNARLTSASGDWGSLKDVLQVRVSTTEGTGGNTGFKTLAQWNAEGGINLPGGTLTQGEDREYTVTLRVPSSAGNEIANKGLTNVTFVVTGTQAN